MLNNDVTNPVSIAEPTTTGNSLTDTTESIEVLLKILNNSTLT